MKQLLLILGLLISTNSNAQFFSDLYKDFLKYSTIYGAGDISNGNIINTTTNNNNNSN